MSSFVGTLSQNITVDWEMATLSAGDLSSDGVSCGQRASDDSEYAGNDLAANHAHPLVKTLENLIVQIIHSHVPESGSTINDANRSKYLEPEAKQLIGALTTFVTALIRSQLAVSDQTESNESNESAAREGSMTPGIVQLSKPSKDQTITVFERHTSSSEEQSVHKLLLEETHYYIFNWMPIRLLTFKPDGSGIELVERSAIWHRISTIMEKDLNESKIKSEIQDIAANMMNTEMMEEQKRKAGIKFLVEKYTRYAILSHTWLHGTPGEITYADWKSGNFDANSRGYRKLANFCRVAATDYGVQFGWMDTICINKESSSELDESIRSMFKWYGYSYRCITYLADTPTLQQMRHDSWFTRGWTLQELLAPDNIKFYGVYWQGIVPGLENDIVNPLILKEICAATTITPEELDCDIWTTPISRRMQWAAKRRVTREEDVAYSLMGIFDVSISTAYGEGSERAFIRLVKEILATAADGILDIVNSGWGDESPTSRTLEHTTALIPSSPREYLWRADRDIHWYRPTNPISLTHLGLRIPVLLMRGASVDPHAPDEFRPIGNYYASAKDVTFLTSPPTCYNYHLLEKSPKRQNVIHGQQFMFFGVLNLLETANNVELPAQGGCFAVPLDINPPPTAAGLLSDECTAWPISTARATVFDLKQSGTDSFIIPKNELRRHGITLRTLDL